MSGQQREKKLWLVATFPTTMAAITMERLCGQLGLPGRLIPVPRAISASCGMAWRAPEEARAPLETMVKEHFLPVEGWYYVML